MPIRISGSTGISGLDGSATTPVLQGASANSGIYYSGNTVFVSTSGTNALTIGPTGNVAFANSSVSIGGQNIAPSYGMKNRIINGDMRIDQRNSGASFTPSSSSAGWSLDRWRVDVSQNSKLTVQQNAGSVTPPTGFSKYLGITSSSSYSVGAGDYFILVQPIEGFNVSDLNLGSASGSSFTLSFWVRSSLTGTFTGAFNGGNSSGATYPFSYSIPSSNTWTKISITVPPTSLGSGWGIVNDLGIQMFLNLGCGSTYGGGTAGAWASGFNYTASGGTSVVGTSGATFYVTGIQLEAGSVSTPFEFRHYTNELQLCQRYYHTTLNDTNQKAQWMGVGFGNYVIPGMAWFPVTMRTAPTISAYAYGYTADPVLAGDGRANNLWYYSSVGTGYSTHTFGLTFVVSNKGIHAAGNGENTTTNRVYYCGYIANAEL